MNERLKYSWGHILAFLALIFIGYVTFMGTMFKTNGNSITAIITVAICVLCLLGTTLGAKIIKGLDTPKTYRAIICERILLILSFIAIIFTFFKYNYFWNVLERKEAIVTEFKNAMTSSKDIFVEYESYASDRISFLSDSLIKTGMNERKAQNRDDELTLVLMSNDYHANKKNAYKWIDDASQNPSVWNAFIFANINTVEEAIEKWSDNLHKNSYKTLSCEKGGISPFNVNNVSKTVALEKLENIKGLYKTSNKLNIIGLLTLILCYGMLLLPYTLQRRNARNCERLWDFGSFTKLEKEKSDEGIYL